MREEGLYFLLASILISSLFLITAIVSLEAPLANAKIGVEEHSVLREAEKFSDYITDASATTCGEYTSLGNGYRFLLAKSGFEFGHSTTATEFTASITKGDESIVLVWSCT